MEIIIYILAAIASFFLWSTIHEISHIAGAKLVSKVESWKIMPYPHFKDGNFRFGGMELKYKAENFPSKSRQAVFNLAPRIANLISIGLLFVALALTGTFQIIWLIVCFAGTIDLIVGSLGISELSDLRKAATNINISPWVLRISGLVLSALSILIVLLILL